MEVVVVVATVVGVVGGGAVAGVGNRRCQKGKVDQGLTGFTLTLCNRTKQSESNRKLFKSHFNIWLRNDLMSDSPTSPLLDSLLEW